MIPLLLLGGAAALWVLSRAQATARAAAVPGATDAAATGSAIATAPAPAAQQLVLADNARSGAEPAFWEDTGDNAEFTLKEPMKRIEFAPSSTLYTALGGGFGGGGGASGGGGTGGGGGHALK